MVAEARRQWLAEEAPTDRSGNPLLFATSSQRTIFEGERVSTDFWQFAEAQVLDALHGFADFAGEGEGFRRRLFAEDAEHGFAFIDVVRKRYDVALMNPPFGECSLDSRALIETEYNESKLDVFACFIERGMDLLVSDGFLGAITSRQGFFSSLDKWRRRWLFGEGRLTALADLGHKVLDKALVEAAAYVIERRSSRSSFWAAGFLDAANKDTALAEMIAAGQGHYRKHEDFLRIPGASVAYWLEPSIIHKLLEHPTMPASLAEAKVGLQTDDDFRFLRLAWECPADQVGSTWRYFAKGGEYSPYYDDIHLTVNWADGAREMRAFIEQRYSWTKNARSVSQYGRLGLTYPERTTSEFSPRVLPSDTIFSIAGPAILPQTPLAAYAVLALSYTRLFRIILEMFIGGGDAVHSGSAARHYKAGFLNQVPIPTGRPETMARLSELGRECAILGCSLWTNEESSRYFAGLRLSGFTSLRSWATTQLIQNEDAFLALERSSFEIERLALCLYDLAAEGDRFVQHEYGMHPAELPDEISAQEIPEIFEAPVDRLVDLVAKTRGNSRQTTKLSFWTDRRYESIGFLKNSSVAAVVRARRSASYIPRWFQADCARQLISYLVGCAFGRWSVKPVLDVGQQDLLSSLPVMSPAMAIESEWGGPMGRVVVDGIAVDDIGVAAASRDLSELVLEVAAVVGQETLAMVQEVPNSLGSGSVREFLASSFFAGHLSAYSKSRRKAPIYWQLSIPSKRYSVWLYYHRINRDTLWRVLNDFVKPKAAQEERRLAALRAEAGDITRPEPAPRDSGARSFYDGSSQHFETTLRSSLPSGIRTSKTACFSTLRCFGN